MAAQFSIPQNCHGRDALLARSLPTSVPASAEQEMTDLMRVLFHLFRDGQHRNVVALARALRMDQSAVKHHLDQLVRTKRARLKIAQGHLYWGITDEGRRHVMELGIGSPETTITDPQPQQLVIARPVE
jgi:hypothetical protein